ncbi:glycerophosphoryl diester phosphodiesterase membrane domain-containing protein [Streptomyces tropicalis]|uniref:Glycerophosphoryl diester phosphodiesterase membrane domain-containing protein n=1 Tax=Streptomyces tropicalis TaxID=3034234 RepID=A0ABT6ADY2_9ACTN|nr:glycerophosphoryl diester phosphodiesterase membrane domain-containing protein [Streptomyces tropicalis]MDF3302860.1 glycerophosphoryl diester phosphodiesterase membrane domain-containing protein [Streptomyces tropicalis]
MNDTPGWASPGSTPPDGQETGTSGPAGDRPDPGQPTDRPGAQPQGPDSRWSTEQPPPAPWSAPTGAPGPGRAAPPPPHGPGPLGGPAGMPGGRPGPVGHGGWGGGWGSGWGGPPPAAKPGVIPLRPLGVGEILDGAVSTMRTYWRTVLGISLVIAVLTETAVVLLQGLVLNRTAGSTQALNNPHATPGELTRAMRDSLLSSGAVFLVSMIGTVLATALLTAVTSRAVLGRPVTAGEAWRDARTQVPRLFGLIALLLLIGTAVIAAGVLPGVLLSVSGSPAGGAALALLGSLGAGAVALWLAIRFSLASPALMLEKQGVVKAMGRSAKLVRGSWWRVLGIQLLAVIIAGIVSAIVVIPFTLIASAVGGDGVRGLLDGTAATSWTYLVISGIGAMIGSTVTLPISAGVTVLLYIDQRIRREALDLELARAAGVQGHSADAPAAGG